MDRAAWRLLLPFYLLFALAFPLVMVWVEMRPAEGPVVCLFRLTTGYDCPGCGITRSFRAMGRLDVEGAFRYNPLGPELFLALLVGWLYSLAMLLTNGRVKIPHWWMHWRFRLFWGALLLYLVLGFGRLAYEMRHTPRQGIHTVYPSMPSLPKTDN